MRSRKGSLKVGVRGAGLLLIACCFSLLLTRAAEAQTAPQEKSAGESAVLELNLNVYESRVRQGSTLTLSLEVVNTGQRGLKIHRANLWSFFSYSRVGSRISGSLNSCGVIDNRTEQWIEIGPGEKFYDTMAFPLERNEFFRDAGHYRISTSLQYYIDDKYVSTVKSTEAEFEIYDGASK